MNAALPANTSTCSGTFYDSGGATGTYSSNQDFTKTFCAATPGSNISVTFTAFQTEANLDKLTIYDGPNTSSPILATATGTSALNQTYTSTTGCLTFRWVSDIATVRAGWAATIACTPPCQPYTIDVVNPTTPFFSGDTIHICQNVPLTLNANGTFTPGGQYAQNNSNLTYTWNFGDGSNPGFVTGLGMTSVTHTWPEGAYYVTVKTKDINNCPSTNNEKIMVLVSIKPTFTGTDILPDTVCPGDEITLDGHHLQTHPWAQTVDSIVAQLTALPDQQNVPYNSPITNNFFIPGQTLTNVSDLISVCLNMEHSYPGDLSIKLYCPNGQYVDLINYTSGNGLSSAFFGQPVDQDAQANAPGVGYTYCWTPNATQTMVQAFAANHQYTFTDLGNPPTTYTNHQYIPAGNYIPQGPNGFASLLGCPLNGSWVINVLDNLSSDNGFIFNWQLHFNHAIIPPVFSYSNSYDSVSFVWTGPAPITQNNGWGTSNPTTSGTNAYTFSVTDDYGCTYDTVVTVIVRPQFDPTCCILPTSNAGNDTALCVNTYTFQALLTQGNTGKWDTVPGNPGPVTILNPNSPNANATVTNWGTYKFTWTEKYLNINSCISVDTITVEFNQQPTSAFSINNIMCHGDTQTVSFDGVADQDPVFVWDWGGGTHLSGNNNGPHTVYWANAGIDSIKLQVFQHGCASQVTVVNILNPESLIYTKTVLNNPCFGDQLGSITLNVQGGTLPITYSWASGTNILSNLGVGPYVVTVKDNNNCQFKDSSYITQPALITYDTAFGNITCYAGQDGFVQIKNVFGGTGVFTYTWMPAQTNSGYQSGLPAGIYNVTFSDANNCTNTESFTLSQPTKLLLNVSQNATICEGGSTTIGASATGGITPYTYLWNGSVDDSVKVVSPSSTFAYISQVRDNHGCLSQSKTVNITVSPKFDINPILTNITCYDSCNGRAFLDIKGGIPPLVYNWASNTNTANNLCAGLYYASITDQAGCDTSLSFTLTKPTQMVYTTSTVNTSCFERNDGSATVSVSGGTPPYLYFWSSGSTSPTAQFLYGGEYNATVTDKNDCPVFPKVEIEEPSRVFVLASDDQTICIGGSVTLNATALGGTPPYDYFWAPDPSSVNSPMFTVNPTVNTTYTLTVIDANNCVGNNHIINVNVYDSLELDAYTLTDTVCPGESTKIWANISGGNGGPYALYLNNGTIVAPPFEVFPLESQYYYLTLHDRCETPTVRDSVKITVMPFPEIMPEADIYSGCVPLKVHFKESSPAVGQKYVWSFGEGVNSQGSVARNPVHTFNNSGTYEVVVTVKSKFGCELDFTLENQIEVYPKPESRFYVNSEVTSISNPYINYFNLTSGAQYIIWNFGDGDTSSLENPTHYFRYPGTYNTELVSVSEHGCKDTASQFVTVKDEYTAYAATAFSPNNDGKNDEFFVTGHGISPDGYHLLIYNKWGEIVFETKDYKAKWDGKIKGKIIEGGVYTWLLIYKNTNGIGNQITGRVTVIR